NVPATRPEGDLHRVRELVDSAFERPAGLLVEGDLLSHGSQPFRVDWRLLVGAREPPRRSRAGNPGRHYSHGARLQLTTASTSRAERTKYSSPLYLISVPPYLE